MNLKRKTIDQLSKIHRRATSRAVIFEKQAANAATPTAAQQYWSKAARCDEIIGEVRAESWNRNINGTSSRCALPKKQQWKMGLLPAL